ncbi:hypothetical protein NDU88_010152 [Pleurodeles waltl]|uniref:Uncharacterized protein n=1 Tax=Pleurodeles waltl TaxID=8319 RepID=A0AAV7RZR7_PLEWA|nr:hypothetical protein NDU88_010152 [Pleurodeles waltl]
MGCHTICGDMAENYRNGWAVDSLHDREHTESQVGGPHRPIVARVLNYRDRDALLQAAKEADPIIVDNVRVSLYPDYMLAVQRRRASFQTVKKRLGAEGLSYALLFPARLRIKHNQKAHFFETIELVRDWLDTTFPHSSHKEQSDALPPKQTRLLHRDRQTRRHPTGRNTGATLSQVLESQRAAIQTAYSIQRISSSQHCFLRG